uniref:Uncharacterized protein n=1 Tax=Rhizophora mucronata TaxID=61149 RepID=A0A2P2J2J6_RHIMU
MHVHETKYINPHHTSAHILKHTCHLACPNSKIGRIYHLQVHTCNFHNHITDAQKTS